ncbi:MAG: 4'-phosphopantetheinyl transferase superfamily protein [Clostridiales bacterium]|nr:4'-phosphopantetheinyl transferase superfamily protein [Clostridiales bacterium]
MKTKIYYCKWDRAVASHELLRQAVSRYLGREPEAFTVCQRKEHGKPFVKELPEVHFSISHSGGFWVCALSDTEVGLDLQICYQGDSEKLAHRFFHPSEVAWLEEHGFKEFSWMWACKESYVKYTGVGLREGLDGFSVVNGLQAVQKEIPFRDGFRMVLTGERDMEVELKML